MDTKYLRNLFVFFVFSILYFGFLSNYINKLVNGKNISVGVFFILMGIFGLYTDSIFLKIYLFELKNKIINCIFIVLGILLFIISL